MKLASVVMAGGIGKRLYPLSTEKCPKYFIRNKVGTSLLEATVFRAKLLEGDVFISCNRMQFERIKKHLSEKFSDTNIRFIIEPISRNTGPILLMFSKILEAYDRIQVLQSDHLFNDFNLFKEISYKMVNKADRSKYCLLTKRFETEDPKEFGQITLSTRQGSFSNIDTFNEKRVLDSKFDKQCLYINVGNQVFNPNLLIGFLFGSKKTATVLGCFNLISQDIKIMDNDIILPDSYGDFPNISVDEMFLERGLHAEAILFSGEWSDIGSIEALNKWLDSEFRLK